MSHGARSSRPAALRALLARTNQITRFRPSTGRGLFDARYDPGAGALVITVTVCFELRDGDPARAPGSGPGASRPDTPGQARWSEHERAAWTETAARVAREAWARRFALRCTRPGWDALPPVNIAIELEAASAEAAHHHVVVTRWPGSAPDMDRPLACASPAAAHEWSAWLERGARSADVQRLVCTPHTRSAYTAAEDLNPGQVMFEPGSAEITPAAHDALAALGRALGRSAMPPFPVVVTGHAREDEDERLYLGEARARAVANILVASGARIQPLARRASAAGGAARSDIVVQPLETWQRPVVHGFGHLIGLDDEWPRPDDGGGRQVGDRVAHSRLAESIGLVDRPIAAHHDDSIMSAGERLEPYHYVTFVEALARMTGVRRDWAVVAPDPGPGDFPSLDQDGTAVA